MIRDAGDRLAVESGLTQATVPALLSEGIAALRQGETLFDLTAVDTVDSSGLALIFAWQRAAKKQGGQVGIAGAPASLLNLAELYGVADLLPLRP